MIKKNNLFNINGLSLFEKFSVFVFFPFIFFIINSNSILSLNLKNIFLTFLSIFFIFLFGILILRRPKIFFVFNYFYLFLLTFVILCFFSFVFGNRYFDLVLLSYSGTFLFLTIFILLHPIFLFRIRKSVFNLFFYFFSFSLILFSFIYFSVNYLGLFLPKIFFQFIFISQPITMLFLIILIAIFYILIEKKRNKFFLFFLFLSLIMQLLVIFTNVENRTQIDVINKTPLSGFHLIWKKNLFLNMLDFVHINIMYVFDQYFDSKIDLLSRIKFFFFGNNIGLDDWFGQGKKFDNPIFLAFLLSNFGIIASFVWFLPIFVVLKNFKFNKKCKVICLFLFIFFVFQLFLPLDLIFCLCYLYFFSFFSNDVLKNKFANVNLVDLVKVGKAKTLRKLFYLYKSFGILLILFSIFISLKVIFIILSFFYLNQSLWYFNQNKINQYYLMSEKSTSFNVMNDIIFKQNAEANLRKSLLLLENNGYFVNYKLDTKVEKQFQNYASQAFRQALKATIINNSSNNWFFLAQVYKNYLGLVENSEKWSNLAFAKAVALQPSNINNYLQWGSLFVLRNKFDQAFEIYNQALKIDPNSSLVNYHLASLMVKKNDFRLALEYYNLALVNLDEGESFLENRLKIIQEIKLINEKNGNNNNNQLNLDRE